MIRNLKALGLALVAVFAMSAVASSVAQAETETGTFSWEAGTTKLTAEADPTAPSQIFTVLGGVLQTTCNEVGGEVEVGGTGQPTLLSKNLFYADTGLTPTKNLCTTNIAGANATVRLNGCNYEFHAGTTIASAPNGETEGTATIVCPGTEIEVEATGCLIKIPGGQTVGPIYYRTTHTSGKPEEVTIEAKVGEEGKPHSKKITYSTSKALCGTHNNETNGTYTGKVTVKGETSTGTQTNVTVT